MENFQTEEQQVEAIKGFWKDHGNSVIGGLIIGFSGFIGFNFYQDSKLASETAVTDSYIAFQESAEKSPETLAEQGESFIQANADSAYASLTAFAIAKDAVSHQDWTAAEKHLNTAIEKSADAGIKAVASLRLARVLIQADKVEQALTTLAQEYPSAFLANVESLKGDAYLMQGKKELARTAYQTAIDNKGLQADPNLQMKLDDLAAVSTLAL
ncbi:MAG: YfgM family protein [Thalassotalea sp.]